MRVRARFRGGRVEMKTDANSFERGGWRDRRPTIVRCSRAFSSFYRRALHWDLLPRGYAVGEKRSHEMASLFCVLPVTRTTPAIHATDGAIDASLSSTRLSSISSVASVTLVSVILRFEHCRAPWTNNFREMRDPGIGSLAKPSCALDLYLHRSDNPRGTKPTN